MKRHMGRLVLFFLLPALILCPVRTASAAELTAPPAGQNADEGAAYAKPAHGTLAAGSIFTDVPRDDWAYEDIRKLVDAAIVGHAGDDIDTGGGAAGTPVSGSAPAGKLSFRPDDLMTREECAVILTRLAEAIAASDTSASKAISASETAAPTDGAHASYADVPPDRWSYKYIEAADLYLRGFYERGGERMYMPEEPILRGDLVTALVKLAGGEARFANYSLLDDFGDATEIDRAWRPYVALALERAILLGHDDGTLQLDGQVTRREACVLIVRALDGAIDFPEPEEASLYVPHPDSGFYDAFFDDAVFVGDSVTMGLRNYVLNQRTKGRQLMGEARFLVAGSYSIRAAAGDFNPNSEVNMSYQGVEAPLEDCLYRMGAKNVFLMLGMNDRAGATLPSSIEMYEKVVEKIYAKNPDANVYIQLCTPISKAREAELLNNVNMDKFNRAIVELCERRGIDWIDVSTPMKDGQNAFKAEYASDGYVHMNAAGSDTWINTLREFARLKYLTGEWAAPVSAGAPETYAGEYVYI